MDTSDAGAPRAPARGIHRAVWSWWQGLNWLLPVATAVVVGVLMPPSPGLLALIPVTALAIGLGSLPRAVLRWRKAVSMPPPITGLVLLNAWSWTAAALAPVLLSRWMEMFDGVERAYFVVVAIACLAWVALLATAIFVPLDTESPRRWTTLAWLAAFVSPLALVGALSIGLLLVGESR
ncbi:hypothetical protein [Microbacterium sp. MYb62]|uniref:hypothetical protein n=1 Tax=Microbacterium sp. MYb62 TaxID=1848690 RepID=UPI000CFD9ACD|nr:hypothetical protein [Microbacterium sp. MYb62]PRB12578.1 hypothetical protein CQ042_15255 [Microbacterium sp. MYb62]